MMIRRRKFLAGVCATALLSGGMRGGFTTFQPLPGSWNYIKIGGGGYATGIDSPVGSSVIVCRTDTAGAYKWNGASWTQLITAASFAGAPLDDRGSGVVEIVVAPSDNTRLYMSYQGDVWVSSDTGSTWTATGLNYETRPIGNSEANNNARYMGQKMAVDPANKNIVYVGTPTGGVKFTLNGGASWSSISTGTIPAGSGTFSGASPGNPGIAFGIDVVGGVTQTIYIPSYGNGVYQSTDGGSTWALLSEGPTQVCHAKIASDGIYYCANVDASTANVFWKYVPAPTGAWTNISSGSSGTASAVNCILPDPANAARIIAVANSGRLQLNTNRGASGSWASQITSVSSVSTDIPWLAQAVTNNLAIGDVIFDLSGNIWMAQGLGVVVTPFSGSPSSIAWNYNYTKGIENLTPNQILKPPNGYPLAAGWDQSVFTITNPNLYNATHSPDNTHTAIKMAWGIDWATSDPTFIAYCSLYASPGNQWGWYSTDKGVSWTQFAGSPSGGLLPVIPNKQGGCIAVSSALNIIIVPSDNALPWYTKDGGATWAEIVISGVPTSGITGWGNAAFASNVCVAADRVTPNCFYLVNYVMQRCYRSTDSGDTWTNMGAIVDLNIASNIAFKLKSVPGNAGHLWMAGGQQGNPGDTNPGTTWLTRSTDGGATWTRVGASGTAIGSIKEPYCVGLGAPKPGGGGYPAVYFAGWIALSVGVYTWGIWRSDDGQLSTPTWTSLGTYPLNLGLFKDVDGSKENYGEIYAELGSGYSYIYRTAD